MSAGLRTSSCSSTSLDIVGSMIESRMYARQRLSSLIRRAAPGKPPKNRKSSSVNPNASRHSARLQWVERSTSKRPFSESSNPLRRRRLDEPDRTTFRDRLSRWSASQSPFTALGHPRTFCTSSSTRMVGFPESRCRLRACCHSVRNHSTSGAMTSSALAEWAGLSTFSSAWAIAVDLPVWRGPATTWMRGLSSSRVLAATASTILR